MRILTRTLTALAVGGMLLSLTACDEKLRDIAGPTPDLQPTFSSIQSQIFDSTDAAGRRACTSCHNTALARFNGGLNLTAGVSYAALVNAASTGKRGAVRVIPGDPDNSYLVQKLEGAPGIVGARMPNTGGPYLTSGQMTILRRWIQIGAPNN